MTRGHWSRYNCNVATRAVSSAISEVQWDTAQVDTEIPAGASVELGIDGARQNDTTAIAPMWVTDDGRCILGSVTVLEPPPDGKGIRDSEIKASIERIRERNPLSRVVVDPYELAAITEWLRDDLGVEVVSREPNNPNACEDRERFMEALREGGLCHTGDPVLRQHVLNATTVEILGRSKFERPVLSRRNRAEQRRRVIDALDAAAMVHSVHVEITKSGSSGAPLVAWR